jgi:hypothetical protein
MQPKTPNPNADVYLRKFLGDEQNDLNGPV